MDIVELADLFVCPPEQSWHEGLDGVAAVWYFWEYVSLRVHLTERGATASEYTTTVHGDSFDIHVPGMPGWQRTVSDIQFTADGRVSDYAISGTKLSDRLMLLTDTDQTWTGAARVIGDIQVCILDRGLSGGDLPRWTKRAVDAGVAISTAAAVPLRAGFGTAVVDHDRVVAAKGNVHLTGRDPASMFEHPAEVSPDQLRSLSEITITAKRCPPVRLRPQPAATVMP